MTLWTRAYFGRYDNHFTPLCPRQLYFGNGGIWFKGKVFSCLMHGFQSGFRSNTPGVGERGA